MSRMEFPWPFETDAEASDYFDRVARVLSLRGRTDLARKMREVTRHFDEKRTLVER